MVVSVSFPSDVATWIEQHWEKGTVSAHIVDLVRITMKGSGSALPRQETDYSKLSINERLNLAVATLTPFRQDFLAGKIGQLDFLARVKSVCTKLNVGESTVLALFPGGRRQ
jgi:hypothetical protein